MLIRGIIQMRSVNNIIFWSWQLLIRLLKSCCSLICILIMQITKRYVGLYFSAIPCPVPGKKNNQLWHIFSMHDSLLIMLPQSTFRLCNFFSRLCGVMSLLLLSFFSRTFWRVKWEWSICWSSHGLNITHSFSHFTDIKKYEGRRWLVIREVFFWFVCDCVMLILSVLHLTNCSIAVMI